MPIRPVPMAAPTLVMAGLLLGSAAFDLVRAEWLDPSASAVRCTLPRRRTMRLTPLGWLALVAGPRHARHGGRGPADFHEARPRRAGAARTSLPTGDCREDTYSVPTKNAGGFVARPD